MQERASVGREAIVFSIVTGLLRQRGLPHELAPDQPLYDAGLNSLDMVNLMLAVEGEFDLEIPPQHMTPENFRSVAAIGRLVEALVPVS